MHTYTQRHTHIYIDNHRNVQLYLYIFIDILLHKQTKTNAYRNRSREKKQPMANNKIEEIKITNIYINIQTHPYKPIHRQKKLQKRQLLTYKDRNIYSQTHKTDAYQQ